jgi:hypothetical protein
VREKKTTCESENLRGPEKMEAERGRERNNRRFSVYRALPKTSDRDTTTWNFQWFDLQGEEALLVCSSLAKVVNEF